MLLRHLKPNHAKRQSAISYTAVTVWRAGVSQGGGRGTLAPAVKKASSTMATSYDYDWGQALRAF